MARLVYGCYGRVVMVRAQVDWQGDGSAVARVLDLVLAIQPELWVRKRDAFFKQNIGVVRELVQVVGVDLAADYLGMGRWWFRRRWLLLEVNGAGESGGGVCDAVPGQGAEREDS